MDIWESGGYVFIRVNNHFVYNINISKLSKLGEESDSPSIFSMWGRINHLRDKNWWNKDLERSFIQFCKEIIKE